MRELKSLYNFEIEIKELVNLYKFISYYSETIDNKLWDEESGRMISFSEYAEIKKVRNFSTKAA